MTYSAAGDSEKVIALGLAQAQCYVPGGLLFGWLIENGGHGPGVPKEIASRFLARVHTGPVAFELCGGVLDEQTISAEFRPFALNYAVADSGLFADMAEWFPVPSIFQVRDTWHNYEWMRICLVERYSQWRSSSPQVSDNVRD